MIVHQVLSSASPRDAVTHEALDYRACFLAWGWGGADYAARIAPGLATFRRLAELTAEPSDILLIHHSAALPAIDSLLWLPNPKLLLYHNITPAEYLWDVAPFTAAECAVGRAQLPALVRAARVSLAHSQFTAAELTALGATRTEVIPLLVDLDRLGPRGDGGPPPGPPVVLFVGRLSPHKGQEPLIRAFAAYRANRAPGARLILVGAPLTAGYADLLRALAATAAPGAVLVESGLSDAALGERYRSATVFVCLSEHEGFCAPVLEAFHAGLPVVARPSGGVPEVAGDAAIMIEDLDPAVISEVIHAVVSDGALYAELVARGRSRLDSFSRSRVEQALRSAVESASGQPFDASRSR